MRYFFWLVLITVCINTGLAQKSADSTTTSAIKKRLPHGKDTASNIDKGYFIHAPVLNMFQNNFRLEADRKFNHGRQSLYITGGPYYGYTLSYVRRNEYDYHKDLPKNVGDDRIKGFSFGAGTRFFFPDLDNGNYHGDGLYPFLGVEYLYRDIHVFYREYEWVSYQNNGLTYYDFALSHIHERITRKSLSFLIGGQSRYRRWTYEAHTGIMLNFTTSSARLKQHRDYNRHPWDYGRTAECMALNFKVGYQLLK